jgi:hypothetical protein
MPDTRCRPSVPSQPIAKIQLARVGSMRSEQTDDAIYRGLRRRWFKPAPWIGRQANRPAAAILRLITRHPVISDHLGCRESSSPRPPQK